MNLWVRDGLFYKCGLVLAAVNSKQLTVRKSLDAISHHLIKWIHGEQELIDMAYRIRRD